MQTGNGRIDLIIACYNGRAMLHRALSSVAMQTVAERVDVTLVDDCSPDGGCAEIAEQFLPLLSVREIRTPQNGGQGVARQFGIDHTRNEFLAFMDQDDSLLGPLALEALLAPMRFCDGVIGRVVFVEGTREGAYALSEPADMPAWVHGKLYRRALLERYGVRFGETPECRQNEDAGFNDQLYMQAGEKELQNIQIPVYAWHDNPNSVSRRDSVRFTYHDGILGYAANMENMFRRVSVRKPDETRLASLMLGAMWRLYATLICAARVAPGYMAEIEAAAGRVYRAASAWLEMRVTDEMLEHVQQEQTTDLTAVYPDGAAPYSFKEFLVRLKTPPGQGKRN